MVLSLLDANLDPIVFDNLSRGNVNALPKAVPLIVGDLLLKNQIENALVVHRPDIVMHFAALAYVAESMLDPERYYENNVAGTINLLAAMRQHGPSRMVFSSTCATYGEPNEVPITETHPQTPINPYGRTKLMVEQALADYSRAYGFSSMSLRYFNAAGSDPSGRAGEQHDPETHLIPLVLAEAERLRGGGRPEDTILQVFGSNFPTPDGTCVRDYIHVTDICQAHLQSAQQLLRDRIVGAQACNLANGTGFSVLEVIEACRAVTGQPIQYRQMPKRDGDPAVLIGSAQHATKLLGWRPMIPDLHAIIKTAWVWKSSQPSNLRSSSQASP